VTVTFVDKNGVGRAVTGKEGQNLVHLAHENDIELAFSRRYLRSVDDSKHQRQPLF
jgi:hypothetical protein